MYLYNTIARKKQEFVPLNNNTVHMYVCGITAYDYCHIGHARSAVVFDVLVRYLRSLGYKVKFVRNFTDIDDKIIKRAQKEGLTTEQVAEKYIQAFYEDMDKLNILRPDIEPRATEHIQEMIDLIQVLEEKGYAYRTKSGDVYFRVRKFKDYGRLSGRNIEELQAGARINPGEEKEDPLDFALWKAAKPGEPKWNSPWGEGRPGWHLECSAMSAKYLSQPFDIHGGGQDLAFPHHENERAQSEAAYEQEFVRYWVHNGFVQISAQKMSKSLGNFVTIRDILNNYLPEVLRFFLLTKHYRSPLDYSADALDEAEKALKRIYVAKELLENKLESSKWSKTKLPEEIFAELKSLEQKWQEAMDDDLNTAKALGYIFNTIRLAGRVLENKSWRKSEQTKELCQQILNILDKWGNILGLFTQESATFLKDLRDIKLRRKNIDPDQVNELVQKRQEARKAKDFALADKVREELTNMGIEVKDTPAGPVWDIV
ncbi:cysteine--tRNA ligase [Desulfohalobiaceae bacterium Ax17]|uniref:cysteine--tRNA ligase n=1 Tax=Desulfovulcanus ferrireducens TaxID=2831190 RepID=UPI00207BABDE|nr:cysteine--tRNA ligase [Desulfovulcanus ferrireducens]MBT8763722.1 cysteine--tRNA ligase [Desulfovulcanus ferrireducens]